VSIGAVKNEFSLGFIVISMFAAVIVFAFFLSFSEESDHLPAIIESDHMCAVKIIEKHHNLVAKISKNILKYDPVEDDYITMMKSLEALNRSGCIYDYELQLMTALDNNQIIEFMRIIERNYNGRISDYALFFGIFLLIIFFFGFWFMYCSLLTKSCCCCCLKSVKDICLIIPRECCYERYIVDDGK
jgi:hypothetical protein